MPLIKFGTSFAYKIAKIDLIDKTCLMEREVLNTNQAAELLGIPELTVIRLARKGIIPGRKAGRLWLFSKSNLIDWVKREPKKKE